MVDPSLVMHCFLHNCNHPIGRPGRCGYVLEGRLGMRYNHIRRGHRDDP